MIFSIFAWSFAVLMCCVSLLVVMITAALIKDLVVYFNKERKRS